MSFINYLQWQCTEYHDFFSIKDIWFWKRTHTDRETKNGMRQNTCLFHFLFNLTCWIMWKSLFISARHPEYDFRPMNPSLTRASSKEAWQPHNITFLCNLNVNCGPPLSHTSCLIHCENLYIVPHPVVPPPYECLFTCRRVLRITNHPQILAAFLPMLQNGLTNYRIPCVGFPSLWGLKLQNSRFLLRRFRGNGSL